MAKKGDWVQVRTVVLKAEEQQEYRKTLRSVI